MKKRELSSRGLDLIKSYEGCRLIAYKVQSTDKYYTIGYGHYGADVLKGSRISMSQAVSLLKTDCERFVSHVNKYMSKYNFNQNQFDALVSFAFNIGNIDQLTKNGTRSISEISEKMLLYCNSNGKKLQGLVNRRKAEQELFNTPVVEPVLKPLEEIAKEVIAGKWGNGNQRKTALTKAGYNYNEVQALVNKMLKGD